MIVWRQDNYFYYYLAYFFLEKPYRFGPKRKPMSEGYICMFTHLLLLARQIRTCFNCITQIRANVRKRSFYYFVWTFKLMKQSIGTTWKQELQSASTIETKMIKHGNKNVELYLENQLQNIELSVVSSKQTSVFF